MEAWIAVYTKPRHEKVVLEKLNSKSITAYLPLIKEKRKWSDRMKWVEIPLFKSYVFAKIELKNQLYVLQTHGVHHIIKLGGQIATIPDQQIEAIRQTIEGDFKFESVDYFVAGDDVEIVGGPMRGVKGIVTLFEKNHKLIIKIDAIQHAIAVHVDPGFVKPVKKRHANTVL